MLNSTKSKLALAFLLGFVAMAALAPYVYPTSTLSVTSTSVNGGFTVLLWNSSSTSWTSSNVTSPVQVPPRTSTFEQNLTFLFSEGTSVTTTFSLGKDAYLTTTYLNASATQTFVTPTGYTYTWSSSVRNTTVLGYSAQVYTAQCGAWNDGSAQVSTSITQCGAFTPIPEFNPSITLIISIIVTLALSYSAYYHLGKWAKGLKPQ